MLDRVFIEPLVLHNEWDKFTMTTNNQLPLFLKTSKMANMIGYSSDFLHKNKEILFFENIHYFDKAKRTNWKVSMMIAWVENQTQVSDKAKEILDLVS